MKVYELEYKMKNARHVKDLSDLAKIKAAKKAMNMA
jgi:hypothetical protein